MSRCAILRFLVFLAAIGLVAGSQALRAQDDTSHHMRKYKAPPPSARIQITVLRDYNSKPIPEAHIIFHPIQGDKDKGDLELKTDEDGKAVIDVLPIGDTVRLQVIADGFQTFGQDYKVDKAEMSMEVRLKRPQAQYSTYNNSTPSTGSGNGSGSGSGSGSGKSSSPSQNSAPPASGTKPSESSGAQPDANQSQPAPK